ncbi:MAG TPA: DUF222 domain-containing protein [Mycobacteriales bacterium]|nr:DUF222 domain-containing protein [Mycobacteriales bacterium]
MSVDVIDPGPDEVAESSRVILHREGLMVVPDDFRWADLPAGGWVGDELASMPPEKTSTAELLDAARVWEKLTAWAAGNQAKVLAEFRARRDAEIEAELDVEEVFGKLREQALESDMAADEMSLALSVAPRTASFRMTFARELIDRLPATVKAMCTGDVSWSKAKTILDQTEDLTPEQTAGMEKMILAWGVGKTPGQVRNKLRREIQKLDPDAAARRRREAAKKRSVELDPQAAGMADLRIHLPGPDAIVVYNWLDEHARAAKAAGDDRTLDQLRADALVDLVIGRSNAVAQKPLIRVLVSADTLAGGDEPGELAGYGPIDAELARELAVDGTWLRFITDPTTGVLKDIDPKKYIPSPALKAYVQARDRTCRFPTCQQPAHRGDIDHSIPFYNGKEPGTSQNPGTVPDNLSALCRRHHRLKDNPAGGWKYRLAADGRHLWTTPEGDRFRVDPDPPLDAPKPELEAASKIDPGEPPPF